MKTRRSKSQWQELVEAHGNSNLSQKAFCEQQGISIASFGYWKRKLKPGNTRTSQSELDPAIADSWIELPLAVQSDKDKANTWHIELDLGNGLCLRLTQQI